jgi:hypothetical protein
LPALEALHKAWTKRAARSKYCDFVPALEAGLAKIEEYYDRTADSDAYTFAMCEITFLSCFVMADCHFKYSIHQTKPNISANSGVMKN